MADDLLNKTKIGIKIVTTSIFRVKVGFLTWYLSYTFKTINYVIIASTRHLSPWPCLKWFFRRVCLFSLVSLSRSESLRVLFRSCILRGLGDSCIKSITIVVEMWYLFTGGIKK